MFRTLTMLAAAVALSGCAAFNNLTSDVSTFSQWPAQRKPSTYAFERLPSQQARPDDQQRLEDAARPALEAAGFAPAVDDTSSEFLVQLNARVDPSGMWLYDDPFWWRGGFFYGRHGRGFPRSGFGFGFGYPATPTYEREVAVLIRDRKSGQALYEARASNDGGSPSINSLLAAMYEAALKDFPNGGVNPRRVTTEISRQ